MHSIAPSVLKRSASSLICFLFRRLLSHRAHKRVDAVELLRREAGELGARKVADARALVATHGLHRLAVVNVANAVERRRGLELS
eukprot:4625267-Prymnesium_polylepis.1